MKLEQVAVVAHDAGGAEILSSYVKRLPAESRTGFLFVLEGPARKIFRAKLGDVREIGLAEAIAAADRILCGSGWQSDLEVRAIRIARAQMKPSTVFLDHWVNYQERFVRDGRADLPDEIWVGDPIALVRARAAFAGLPVALVENPYFLDIADEFRVRHQPAPDTSSVLFVGEPVREHALRQHGNERHWGYTEEEALAYFLDHLDALPQPVDRVRVRPHPAEPAGKYAALVKSKGHAVEMSTGRTLFDDIASCQWVAGCNSMAMVAGLVAGRRVLCCIPPGGADCVLPHPEILHLRTLLSGAGRDH
jgi:hypothetical protein